MKKIFLATVAFSICLLAASCGNQTDPSAGVVTDTTTMGPPPSSAPPSDNTGTGISNSGDTSMNGSAVGQGNGQSGSMSQKAVNSSEIEARNGASGTANSNADRKQQDAKKRADTPNNATGLGQSK